MNQCRTSSTFDLIVRLTNNQVPKLAFLLLEGISKVPEVRRDTVLAVHAEDQRAFWVHVLAYIDIDFLEVLEEMLESLHTLGSELVGAFLALVLLNPLGSSLEPGAHVDFEVLLSETTWAQVVVHDDIDTAGSAIFGTSVSIGTVGRSVTTDEGVTDTASLGSVTAGDLHDGAVVFLGPGGGERVRAELVVADEVLVDKHCDGSSTF